MQPFIWGGVMLSPLIGLFSGAVFRPAYRQGFGSQLFLSLLTLYAAAFTFGAIAGTCDALRMIPNRLIPETIVQGVLGTLFGTTIYLFYLWPLSFFNHVAVCSLSEAISGERIDAD
jgi:hypothetical protein